MVLIMQYPPDLIEFITNKKIKHTILSKQGSI